MSDIVWKQPADQCPYCREDHRRDSYCVCPPDDTKCPPASAGSDVIEIGFRGQAFCIQHGSVECGCGATQAQSTVIHPNFRIGPGQKNVGSRTRAFMVSVPQEVFDMIMNEVDQGRATSSRDVIARALEKHLNLPAGSATKE